ncbi:MAG: hypothetical protein Fur0032_20970 [Terrimicrobiaceae bacterium]
MIQGTVQISDQATPELIRIRGLVQRPRSLMAAAGKRVERELRGHFLKKNRQGNRRGWVRSNFWSKVVRQATAFTGATDNSAEIGIASPEFVHKLRGGTIRPRRGRALAIPLTSRAKAAGSPREWDDSSRLVPIKTRKGLFLMVSQYKGKERGGIKGQRLIAAYKLVPKVTHKPDPTALPPDGALEGAVEDEAMKYLDRLTKRGGPAQ